MKVTARLRYLNMSPRKVRAVAQVIRGLPATSALQKLTGVKRQAVRPVSKLLRSAIANAENNFALDRQTLRIESLAVDSGSTLKRYQPRARGRAVPIRRRTSHLIMVLEGERTLKPAPAKGESKTVEKKIETLPRKEEKFEVEKKVGREQRQSFVKRFFRRKSI